MGDEGAVCACKDCSRRVAEIIAVGQERHDGMLRCSRSVLNSGGKALRYYQNIARRSTGPSMSIDENERPVYSTD